MHKCTTLILLCVLSLMGQAQESVSLQGLVTRKI